MAAAAVADDSMLARGLEYLRTVECAAAEGLLAKMAVALRSRPGRRYWLVVEVRTEEFPPDRSEHWVDDIGLEAVVDTLVTVDGCEHHAERLAGDTAGAVAAAKRGFVQCYLLRCSAKEAPSIVAVAYEAVERRAASLGVAADVVGAHNSDTVATEASRSLVDAAHCRTGAADVAS